MNDSPTLVHGIDEPSPSAVSGIESSQQEIITESHKGELPRV